MTVLYKTLENDIRKKQGGKNDRGGIRYMHKCIKILATNADKRYASGNLTEK